MAFSLFISTYLSYLNLINLVHNTLVALVIRYKVYIILACKKLK